MKNRILYKKEPKIEICYQVVITTGLVTCNLPRVQSLTSLITQIQSECTVQVSKGISVKGVRSCLVKIPRCFNHFLPLYP